MKTRSIIQPSKRACFTALGLTLLTFVSCPASSVGANLIKNPSFEDLDDKGGPAGWSFTRTGESEGSLRVVEEGRTGKRVAVLTKTGSAGQDGVYMEQWVEKIEPDTTYIFTAWVKGLAEEEVRFDLLISARGENPAPGLKLHIKNARKSFFPTREWKQYRLELPIGSNHHYVGARLLIQLFTADAPIVIKDVSLVAVPRDGRQKFLRKDPSFYKLFHKVVTPHIAWAKPYYRGPIRVLVIAPGGTQRETLEIAQRLDIDFTTAFTKGADALGWDPATARPHEKVEGMFPKDVEKDILEKLQKPYDVIILGSMNWDALSLDIKYEILRAVKSGAGLVIGYEPPGTDDIYKKAFAKPLPDREKYVTAGVPLTYLPAFAEYATDDEVRARYIRTAALGKGRIICVRYSSPIWYRSNYLSPSSRFVTTRSFLEYDYYLSLAAKAVLWAAGKEPDILVSSIRPVQTPLAQKDLDKDSLKLELLNEGRAREFSFRIVARDPDGRPEYEGSLKRSVPKGRSSLTFKLAHLPTGRHFVDVFIRDGKAVVNWASAAVEVSGPVSIQSIKVDPEGYNPGDTIEGKLILAGTAPPQVTATVEFYDNHGRLLQALSPAIVAGAKTLRFNLSAGEPLTVMHKIVARIVAGEKILSRAELQFPIRMAPPDDFQWITWDSVGVDYIQRRVLGVLSGLGVDAINSGTMYDPRYARMADTAYRENLQLIPVSTGLLDRHTGKDPVREPCLTDPGYLAKEKAKVGAVAKALAKYAPIAYSLGDEGRFAHDKDDLCHSETCQADFRVFLKEMYGTLAALNAEWETFYRSWDQIRKMTLAEAKKRGNFAPWCDHRLHSDAVWTRIHVILRDEIRKYQPNAKVGDASFSQVGTYQATDWPAFAKTLGFMQMYTYETDAPQYATLKMLERDFSQSKDVMFGYVYGSYDYWGLWSDNNEDTQRYYPWRILFEGGNSCLWYSGFGSSAMAPGVERGIAQDLTVYDVLKWAAEEIGEVKRGPAKLLMNAERLHDGVAFLYSQPSIHAAAIDQTLTRVFEDGVFMVPYVQLFADIGINPIFIATQDIEEGRLEQGGIRVLVLPFSQALSDKQCEGIREFVRAGGTVIADLRPAVMDAHCKFRPTGGLDDVFGLTHTSTAVVPVRGDISATTPRGQRVKLATQGVAEANLKPSTAKALGNCAGTPVLFLNPYGKGRGIYLNFAMDHYQSSWEDRRGARTRSLFTELLADAGVTPQPAVASDDEMNLHGLRRVRFTSGDLQYLGLLRDGGSIGGPTDKSPKPLQVKLAKSVHLYDVRQGQYLGVTDSFDTKIVPARAHLYALLPYQVKGIKIRDLKRSYKPGDTVACRLRIDSGKGKPGRHVLRVELFHPSMKSPTPYARNLLAEGGKCDVRFRLALNDPPGKWTMTVRDVATGTATWETFTLSRREMGKEPQ